MRHAEKSSITKWWLCIFSSISILLKGFVCQLIFTGAQEARLHIWEPVLCSSFWWQNAKVEHAMPNIPETSSTIAALNDVLLFLLRKAYRAAKMFSSFFFLNAVRHSNGIQLPFQHEKSNKQTCPALQFHVVQSYEDRQQNSHILPFKYIRCTTYRDMPQINFPIHIYRDLFPMLCSVLFVKHWIVFPPNILLKIARKSL